MMVVSSDIRQTLHEKIVVPHAPTIMWIHDRSLERYIKSVIIDYIEAIYITHIIKFRQAMDILYIKTPSKMPPERLNEGRCKMGTIAAAGVNTRNTRLNQR